MAQDLLWSIGSSDGRSADLLDTYKDPNRLDGVVWRVGGKADQRWPLYHPSEADPDAGYRPHPYTVLFDLGEPPAGPCLLRIEYLSIAPRVAHLRLELNGCRGEAWPRPAPSKTDEIRLHSGLHTPIYVDGVCEVVLPAALFRTGENRLVLTAVDGGEFTRVENLEKIKRLDRMASGAGLVYQRLSLSKLGAQGRESPTLPADAGSSGVLARLELDTSVVYRRGARGELLEECALQVELNRALPASTLRLQIEGTSQAGSVRLLDLPLPATSFGHLRLPLEIEDGEGPVRYRVTGELGGEKVERAGEVARKRKWKVFVAPHAHTDVGYTHRQWEVAERLCRNLDAALELSDTSTYHLDSAWTLEHFLATRSPAQVRRLADAMRDGRIGTSATYVDLLSHTAALEDLVRNCAEADALLGELGAKSDFAAVVDVASLTQAFPDVLAGAGIRYLVHANNQDRGPFCLNGGLHRANPFYWEGPGGGRVLVWLAKTYCELRKVCGSPPIASAAARGLDLWLAEFETDSYKPDCVLLYGQEVDNTDLDPQPADFVRRWNETHAFPQLIPCCVSEFFQEVEARFGPQLRTFHGDEGAYREDGVSSSLASVVWAREAQASLPAAERLDALSAIHEPTARYPREQYDAAWRQLLLWDEHTFSAFLSGPEPQALLQRDQFAVKQNFARQSLDWSRRLLHAAATRHSLRWNNAGREVVVYNPNSWPTSGSVVVELEPNEIAVDAASGAPVPMRPVRVLRSLMAVQLWIDSLEPFAYRRLVLERRPERAQLVVRPETRRGPITLESPFYRITLDTDRGCATSLFDKELGRELVHTADRWGFGQLLYARGGEGTRLLNNRAGLPEGNPEVLGDFTLRECTLERFAFGTSFRMYGSTNYGELDVEWTLQDCIKRVDVRFHWRKEERLAKEAVYVAFPSALEGASVLSDSHLGWVDWHRDSMPGACKEWLPLQTGILVEGDGAGLHIGSPDVPLFCVGDVVRGRWPRTLDLTGGRVFSYVLNNYWDTNYPASQGGELTFSYHLTSGAHLTRVSCYQRGWEARRPLYGQQMSFQDFRAAQPPYEAPAGGALACVEADGVVVSALKAASRGEGYVLRVQEVGGKTGRIALRFPNRPIASAIETDLLERDGAALPVADGRLELEVRPWALRTVRLRFAEPD